jgi:hypothetical protein
LDVEEFIKINDVHKKDPELRLIKRFAALENP